MITYDKSIIGNFNVYHSKVSLGDIHKKKFISTNISPLNQETLNLYAGSFNFSIPSTGFSQNLLPGHSSLDLNITEYPLNTICEEHPLEDMSVRYCISPVNKQAKWKRYTYTFTDELLNITLPLGSIVFLCNGTLSSELGTATLFIPISASMLSSNNATIIVAELIL